MILKQKLYLEIAGHVSELNGSKKKKFQPVNIFLNGEKRGSRYWAYDLYRPVSPLSETLDQQYTNVACRYPGTSTSSSLPGPGQGAIYPTWPGFLTRFSADPVTMTAILLPQQSV